MSDRDLTKIEEKGEALLKACKNAVSKCQLCGGTGIWRQEVQSQCPVLWCQQAREAIANWEKQLAGVDHFLKVDGHQPRGRLPVNPKPPRGGMAVEQPGVTVG